LLVFFGTYRGEPRHWPDSSAPEAATPVVVTLMTLAVASIVTGFIGISARGGANSIVHLLASGTNQPDVSLPRSVVVMLLLLTALLPLAGILVARHLFSRDPAMDLQLDRRWPDGHELLANRYFFDELYGATIVSGTLTMARTVLRFDRRVIGGCVNACGWTAQIFAWSAHMIDTHVVDRSVDTIVRLARRLNFLLKCYL